MKNTFWFWEISKETRKITKAIILVSGPRSDGKARILLKRHEDGSLGIGIKGGKEYNAPIVVYLVEPGSQAAAQVGS